MSVTSSKPPIWDIFCRVVDNFGDAGVCWRLAKQLNREHGLHVRLWIEDLVTLRALVPVLDAAKSVQDADGIRICRWSATAEFAGDAAVVIEAFGCNLPEDYVGRMATRTRPPLWLVLEYLSAEPWVDHHHGLASPHPRLPLQRFFFFPGFTPATGGLIREADLLARHEAFDAAARRTFWRDLGYVEPSAAALTLSLFAYETAPIADFLATLAYGGAPVVVALPAGKLVPAVRAFFGAAAPASATAWRQGALEVRVLPFLPQAGYDELLRACDVNFVRGEDSFVRALWAARPLVWQPYRQDDSAHLCKMEAFLYRYCAGLDPMAASALRAFWRCWNSGAAGEIAAGWSALRPVHGVLAIHAGRWTQELSGIKEMSAQLVEFVNNKVE